MDFLVGTFTHDKIYTLRFTPPSQSSASAQAAGALEILQASPAVGKHSWLTLSPSKSHLYTTVWVDPPTIAAYKLQKSGSGVIIPQPINTKPVRARSACLAVSETHVYSTGGPSGEVYAVRPTDGALGELVQELSFEGLEAAEKKGKKEEVPHGDFGGIRHGAHSAELSPDGKAFYVADIGRNCIWTFAVGGGNAASSEQLHLGEKHASPRSNDGPRHTTPHPNGKMLYSLQEHSSMVDVFAVAGDLSLSHVSGVRIIPADKDEKEYWADEVRVGSVLHEDSGQPKYLYASTRGLKSETKGYVAVFALDAEGAFSSSEPLDMYETATSGGWANAVEPAPLTSGSEGSDYVAMTDSEEGWVSVLGFNGTKIWEAAKVKLGSSENGLVGAATAVWL